MTRNQIEIMILDTNEEALEFFQKVLEGAGYKVSLERSLAGGI